jgi:predicted flap endonuclease-1-like 5' DNA nuclease
LKRILRLAVVAAIIGAIAGFIAKNRQRIADLYVGYVGERATVDEPGSPPVAPGRYAPDVEFVGGQEDDLTSIRGIGPSSAEQLKAAGITTFEKLADLNGQQVMQVLSSAPPGADFESWVAQARELAEARRA